MNIPVITCSKYYRAAVGVVLALSSIVVFGCANTPGDEVECPICNNTTELLVGVKCVPIAAVETCGPDGHLHGSACHCFGGQQPTSINGQDYCLQQGCGEREVDTDALACDEIGRVADIVTAVTAIADVERAHVAVGTVVEVKLPAKQPSFVHFEASEAGEFLVYAATSGIIGAALNQTGGALEALIEGTNAKCPTTLAEVWGIQAMGKGPVVLRFNAMTIPGVKLVITKSAHAH